MELIRENIDYDSLLAVYTLDKNVIEIALMIYKITKRFAFL